MKTTNHIVSIRTKIAYGLFGDIIRQQSKLDREEMLNGMYSPGVCTTGCRTRKCTKAYKPRLQALLKGGSSK